MRFPHVLVVGAGQMGGGIAQVMAASGRRVSLYDAAPAAVERGLEAMRKSLTKLAVKGGPDPDEVLARVEPVDELVQADLMVEGYGPGADVYVCGPSAFVESVADRLVKAGHAAERVRTERFG